MIFQLFRRRGLRGRRWYFRLRAANGEIVVQSEGYAHRADALGAIQLIRNQAVLATIKEIEPPGRAG